MTREEAIKTIRLTCPKISDSECDFETAMRFLIPELRESEDERIRKGLIEVVSDITGGWPFEEHGITKKKALAYLEKQNDSVSNAKYIEDVAHAFEDGRKKGIEEKQKPVDLTGELSTNDSSNSSGLVARNLTPEQMREETLKPVEWSEEDERLLTKLMTFVDIECFDRECNGQDVIDWLKSLRPHWKPSDVCYGIKGDPDPAGVWKPSVEQMEALHTAVYLEEMQFYGGLKDKLRDLYEQLKKLM